MQECNDQFDETPKGGWLMLWRSMGKNPVLSKAAYRAVWIELLIRATYEGEDRSVVFDGRQKQLETGQLVCGRKMIADKLQIPESTVQRVLKRFEEEQMIEQETDMQKRLITIKKWKFYQTGGQASEQRKNNAQTTNEHLYKKEKKEKIEYDCRAKILKWFGQFNSIRNPESYLGKIERDYKSTTIEKAWKKAPRFAESPPAFLQLCKDVADEEQRKAQKAVVDQEADAMMGKDE